MQKSMPKVQRSHGPACACLTSCVRFRRYMPSFKEQWLPVRTPEQFQLFYNLVKEVASKAKIKFVGSVEGLEAFQEKYQMPTISAAVEDKTVTIGGERRNIWPLAEFLESEALGFKFYENHELTCNTDKEVADIMSDLQELTSLYGWGLDKA